MYDYKCVAYTFELSEFTQANTTLQILFPLHFPSLVWTFTKQGKGLSLGSQTNFTNSKCVLIILGKEIDQYLSLLSIAVIENNHDHFWGGK